MPIDVTKLTCQEAITAAEAAAELTYIIVEENDDEWMVKVGCTRNEKTLKRRLTNLNTGNPRRLHIYAVFYRGDNNCPSLMCEQYRNTMGGYWLEQGMLRGALARYRVGDSEWVKGVSPDAIVRLALYGEVPPEGTSSPWTKVAAMQLTGRLLDGDH